MSRSPSLTTFAATLLVGFSMLVFVLLADGSRAEERLNAASATPESGGAVSLRGSDVKARLDEGDEIAMLAAVQLALNEVGDGSTYVWYRANGRLSGLFQPTASFKDGDGKICRHLKMTLTSGSVSKATEGIACRVAKGIWALEG